MEWKQRSGHYAAGILVSNARGDAPRIAAELNPKITDSLLTQRRDVCSHSHEEGILTRLQANTLLRYNNV